MEQGAGETVVLLHGVGTDYRVWNELLRRAGNEFRFVAYSRRHHAPNAWPDDGGSHTMAQHAEDLVGLIKALGPAPAHVVGVSLGGRIAAHAAIRYPRVVRTLTLNDALLVPPLTDEGKRSMDAFGERFDTVLERIRAGEGAQAAAALVDWLSPATGGWSGLSAARQRYYLDNAATLALATRDRTMRLPGCEALGTIRFPALILAGENTPDAFRVTNEAAWRCLPSGTEIALVPRAAHYWYAENPDDGARLLREFLRKHRSP